jgi:hypothetical protein
MEWSWYYKISWVCFSTTPKSCWVTANQSGKLLLYTTEVNISQKSTDDLVESKWHGDQIGRIDYFG